jgi:hypothetical protein
MNRFQAERTPCVRGGRATQLVRRPIGQQRRFNLCVRGLRRLADPFTVPRIAPSLRCTANYKQRGCRHAIRPSDASRSHGGIVDQISNCLGGIVRRQLFFPLSDN